MKVCSLVNNYILEQTSGMVRIDKSSKKSLALEEAKASARDYNDEFKPSKPKKKLKHSSIRKLKSSKRNKRKRADEVSQKVDDQFDDMIFDNNECFDISDSIPHTYQSDAYQSIQAAQMMRRVNVKHNLSKVEEEEIDDTLNESRIQNTLITKNFISNEYKSSSAQQENQDMSRFHMLSKHKDMEIYFEQDQETD